jgi:hypothetical protein
VERIKNRLEKTRAVPKWEAGTLMVCVNPAFSLARKNVARTPRIFKKR